MNSYLRIFQSIVHLESHIPENCIVASVFNLLRLTSDLNTWTSNFVVTRGDQSIDVSSAAQGALSSSPSGVYPHQNIPFSCMLGCQLLFSVRNIFLPIYSNFSIPAVFLSIPVITAVICSQ